MTDLFTLTLEALAGIDIKLVDIERGALGLLKVTIERIPIKTEIDREIPGITLEDCQLVSKQLSHLYQVEEIDYKRLEVGSPGVDRPLRTEEEFQRFIGNRVQIKLRTPLSDGRKVISGILMATPNKTFHALGSEVKLKQELTGTLFSLEFEMEKNVIQTLTFMLKDIVYARLDPVLVFRKGKKR